MHPESSAPHRPPGRRPSLTHRPWRRLPLLLLTLLAATGCDAVDSADVPTHDLEAHLAVTTFGGREAQVTVKLLDARGPWSSAVELTGGDALTVFGPGGARALYGTGLLNDIEYTNTVAVVPGATRLRLALDRPWHLPAPATVVDLPPPFELDPLGGGPFDFDREPIPLSWAPRGVDPLALQVTGWCILDHLEALPGDRGYALLNPGRLVARSDWRGEPCELTVRLTRTRLGVLDPGLAGGEAWASQVRETRLWIEAY